MITKNKLWPVMVMLICLCLLSPISSKAAQIQVTDLGYNEILNISMGSIIDKSVHAGFYNLNLTGASDPIWDGAYISSSFCVEDQYITIGTIYNGYDLYGLAAPFTNAAWLMNQYLSVTNNNHLAASLQVAIWESIFDPSGFDLGNGIFKVNTSTSTWNRTLSEGYLTALAAANLTSFNTAAYRVVSDDGIVNNNVLMSGGHQDYIVYNPAVPIPGAVWLFGSGLIGIIGIRRRFRK